MSGETADINDATKENSGTVTRELSTIGFPYVDLDESITVAQKLNEFAGNAECELSELAAHMGQSATGGGFRLKIAAAKLFGLAASEQRGKIQITPLGNRIIHPGTASQAKVDAFLTMPLYSAIYENRKGSPLPVAAALEREIGQLGVSSKQKAKARQVLTKSADQAGFIQKGTDRFVVPPKSQRGASDDTPGPGTKPPPPPPGNGGGDDDLHPFIQGLLQTLPKPDTVWPEAEREKWLTTAKQIFGLIYIEGTIDVTLDNDVAELIGHAGDD